VRYNEIFKAWGRILTGRSPVLSIEITKECPLSCPGCYAFEPEHLGGTSLTSLSDFKGEELIRGVMGLVETHRPLGVYFVGGEPLVRYRELGEILPLVCARTFETHVVTSAVRPIPIEWSELENLKVVVSIDGLQPEHDARRKPATYERIFRHIEGHRITVHCTITSQMMQRDGYIEEFMTFWSGRSEVEAIQVSLFTPQIGTTSVETLSAELRGRAIRELGRLSESLPKIRVNPYILKAFMSPPSSPRECVFARVTKTVSADLKTVVEPCQLGGNPDCSQCGCLGSMGLHAVAEYTLPVGMKIRPIFDVSDAIGSSVRRWRGESREPSGVVELPIRELD
jgi:sulfatase maturation enzyme AslB (radical SAM superfamily)